MQPPEQVGVGQKASEDEELSPFIRILKCIMSKIINARDQNVGRVQMVFFFPRYFFYPIPRLKHFTLKLCFFI